MSAVVATEIASHYTKIPNDLLDCRKTPYLTTNQRYVYIALMRHSYGYHKDACKCSLEYLQAYTGIGAGTVRSSIKHLKALQLIEQLEPWHFRVKLPSQIPVKAIPKTEIIPEPIDKICNDVLQNLTLETCTNQANIESHEFTKDKDNKDTLKHSVSDLDISISSSDLQGSSLSGMTQQMLAALCRLYPVVMVLRFIITCMTYYKDKKDVVIASPVALFKWALKAKNQFVWISDSEIKDRIKAGVEALYSNIRGDIPLSKDHPREMSLWELIFFYEKLLTEDMTLEQLYKKYHQKCYLVAHEVSFLELFKVSPTPGQPIKKIPILPPD